MNPEPAGALVAMPAQRDRYDDPKLIDAIKETVCKGASTAQLRMFIEVCRRTRLDPFLKEIYYVPEKGIIMAGRDGYLRVANEDPHFDGMKTVVERDAKNVPIKATCTVWRKDRNHPIECEAYYSEYRKSSPVWTTYPSAMISKVAEVLALKRSFAINGVVTEEEIGNDGSGSVEAAKQVAREKIAELGGDPSVVDAPPPESETHKKLVAAFSEVEREFMKFVDQADEWSQPYHDVLAQYGVTQAAHFPDTPEGIRTAKRCYKALSMPLAQLRHPEPEPAPEVIEDGGFSGTFNIKTCVEKFQEMKARFATAAGASAGEAEYRRILLKHGMKSSNQFREAGPATLCYIEMASTLKQVEGLGIGKDELNDTN